MSIKQVTLPSSKAACKDLSGKNGGIWKIFYNGRISDACVNAIYALVSFCTVHPSSVPAIYRWNELKISFTVLLLSEGIPGRKNRALKVDRPLTDFRKLGLPAVDYIFDHNFLRSVTNVKAQRPSWKRLKKTADSAYSFDRTILLTMLLAVSFVLEQSQSFRTGSLLQENMLFYYALAHVSFFVFMIP